MATEIDVHKAIEAVNKAVEHIHEVLQECVKKLIPVIEKITQIYELSVPTRKNNTRRKFAVIACKGNRHGKELQEKVHTNRRSWDYRPDKRRIHKASGIRKIR